LNVSAADINKHYLLLVLEVHDIVSSARIKPDVERNDLQRKIPLLAIAKGGARMLDTGR